MRRQPSCGALWVVLIMLGAGAASASPALVVAATADDDALRAAMAEVGFAALTKSETASVLQAAAGSGVVCVDVDVACWQAVATTSSSDNAEARARPMPSNVARSGTGRLRSSIALTWVLPSMRRK